jgi:hypothetical protein
MESKTLYRIWQFWKSITGTPGELDWGKIKAVLSPSELSLFQQLPSADQNHSLRVLEALEKAGEKNPHLLESALLHDIGKIIHPLRLWERVFAVLVKALFPVLYMNWGEGEPRGIKRPLVIIKQHPEWGAVLAESAGSSPTTVWLILNHEKDNPTNPQSEGDLILLEKLQAADNQN